MKTVWTSHSTELPDRAFAARHRAPWISKALSPVGRAGKGRQARKVETEIVVSDHNLRFVEDEYPGARGHLQRIYHSRLGDDALRPPVPREPIFLSVGHLTYRKGQHVLAKAFLKIAEELPGWKLVIVGGDSGGDGCGKDIRDAMQADPHGSRITLAGAHDTPVEWMERASIFLQPSLEEALGLALQEALFAGCPSIGSRAGGIPEVIDEGENGLLVPPGDVDALADAMLRLARDEGLRQQMSKVARESIIRKGMNRGAMIEAHRQLYHSLLA
jgi:glycosyltransferase involved in cell wall biosynthesis